MMVFENGCVFPVLQSFFFFPQWAVPAEHRCALQVRKVYLAHNGFNLSIFLSCGHARMKFRWDAMIMTLLALVSLTAGLHLWAYKPAPLCSTGVTANWATELDPKQQPNPPGSAALLSGCQFVWRERKSPRRAQLLAFPLWKTLTELRGTLSSCHEVSMERALGHWALS